MTAISTYAPAIRELIYRNSQPRPMSTYALGTLTHQEPKIPTSGGVVRGRFLCADVCPVSGQTQGFYVGQYQDPLTGCHLRLFVIGEAIGTRVRVVALRASRTPA